MQEEPQQQERARGRWLQTGPAPQGFMVGMQQPPPQRPSTHVGVSLEVSLEAAEGGPISPLSMQLARTPLDMPPWSNGRLPRKEEGPRAPVLMVAFSHPAPEEERGPRLGGQRGVQRLLLPAQEGPGHLVTVLRVFSAGPDCPQQKDHLLLQERTPPESLSHLRDRTCGSR